MKKFIIKIAVMAILLIAIDYAIGLIFDYCYTHNRDGSLKQEKYYDLMIYGSSRANHHYVPKIFEEEFNMTAFNAGKDGEGSVLHCMRIIELLEKYKPKVIIYDAHLIFDYATESDNTQFLGERRCDYGRSAAADSIFLMVNPRERYKMMCKAYQYNSQLQILKNFRNGGIADPGYDGYEPLQGQIKDTSQYVYPHYDADSIKIYCLQTIINRCKQNGVALIFSVSPAYNVDPGNEYEPIRRLCKANGIPFVYHLTDSSFLHNTPLFKDHWHLNDSGAQIFSRMVAPELHKIYLQYKTK
jgi:hypothetical protein